jgi:1-deoxy-D-xylulose-5-phosphate synthase
VSQHGTPILDTIRSPADLHGLSVESLTSLAAEMRHRITQVVAERGGHLASSLGVVELTIALHRAYDFSRDRLVFDVGHQCYPHKLLTGRNDRFDTLRTEGGLSGFPNHNESPYDVFIAGHASTAISSALGMSCAIGKDGPRVVAMVGDGAIAGGLAFEAMNSAGHMDADLLVVLNDNEMSIGKTVGAFSKYLARLRVDPLYNELRKEASAFLERLPLLGAVGRKLIDVVRHALAGGGVFEALGFRYIGPVDGHSIPDLESTLRAVHDLTGPVLLHVLTRKGEGHEPALADPTSYHSPACEKVAADIGRDTPAVPKVTYTDIAANTITDLGTTDTNVVAITAAMPEGTGLCQCSLAWPSRCYDVGICEAHAVTFASGLARAGKRPIVAVYSTFLQRAVDSIFHDVCLQGDIPVVLCIDRAGFVGADGPTHHGLFDIAMLRAIPNIVLAAPRDGDELAMMIRWASASGKPVAIRYPRAAVPPSAGPLSPIELGRAETLSRGERAAIIAYGASVAEAVRAGEILAAEGIRPTVVNARFAKPLDDAMLSELASSHEVLITAEEGALIGGFGSAVMESASRAGWDTSMVKMLGVADRFVAQATREAQLVQSGIDAASIAEAVRAALGT